MADKKVLLQADPEPLDIDVSKVAIVVIDMQNAFVSNGGMVDLWGGDIEQMRKAIEPIKRIIKAAHKRECKVIYVTHKYAPDLRDSGGPSSPNWYKERSLRDFHKHPEWRDKLLLHDTWGAKIIDELRLGKDDIEIVKLRYSAFFGTGLDMILSTCGVKYLVFSGVTTNICVETSIRDAYNYDYFPILVSDAAASMPSSMHESTIHNVSRCFGWVTTSKAFVTALEQI
jgi:ureidoacrylate peracid hydrolase